MNNPIMMDKQEEEGQEDIHVKDGELEPTANYTVFVELICN